MEPHHQRHIEGESHWITLASVVAMVAVVCAVWARVLPPFGQLPGDIGDTRFNMYALEHSYQWLIGNSSLWNMPMFWPLT